MTSLISNGVRDRYSLLSRHTDGLVVYALVDGFQYQQHFGRAIEAQENITRALFAGTEDEPLAHAGPWIIAPSGAKRYGEEIVELEEILPSVLWLIVDTDMETLATRLQSNLNRQLPDSSEVLLRFWDPRVFRSLIKSLDPSSRSSFFGHVTEWHFLHNGERFYLNVHDHA